ncbi:MAG: hypothetical protein ACLTAI_13780 [Thomasclavelia sp.]
MENLRLASVKFKSAGKSILFFCRFREIEKGDYVVVGSSARGLELGEISQGLMAIRRNLILMQN